MIEKSRELINYNRQLRLQRKLRRELPSDYILDDPKFTDSLLQRIELCKFVFFKYKKHIDIGEIKYNETLDEIYLSVPDQYYYKNPKEQKDELELLNRKFPSLKILICYNDKAGWRCPLDY